MKTFDLFIPYSMYDGDPILIDSFMNEFADYVLGKYKEKIDEELSKHDRYPRYKKVYGSVLKEFLSSKGYPDVEFSGSLVTEAMIKKETREGILMTISSMSRLSGHSTEQFIRIMEYGSSKFPALNILRKVNREVLSSLWRYYAEFRDIDSSRSRKRANRYRDL